MDGRDARIAAKRARKQEEAEMASAYERLKQELADHRGVASPSDPGDAPESEEEEEEEQSNLQLDLLDDFCRGPKLLPPPTSSGERDEPRRARPVPFCW